MPQKLLNNSAKSIYIHIPFCKKKCNYCAFVSFTNIQTYENLYINALQKEIENFSSANAIKTIYLGGGTPNLLSINSVQKILVALYDNFKISSDAEITIECNPKISNLNYFKELKKLGANRISLGVQSFNSNLLTILNRLHTKEEALKAISDIERAGFENYSIDLMYGIFAQNIEMLQADLDIIKDLKVPHISTYGLKIEENTPFYKYPTNNLPDEDLCEKMYLLISEELEKQGYTHYEISNFAKNNCASQHNLTYWRNEEYYGFGVGAHGYLNKTRYQKSNNLEDYIKNPASYEILNINSAKDILEEKIFLGLRLKEGINLQELKEKYNFDLIKIKKQELDKFISNGYAKIEKSQLSLTTRGFLISNYIIGELLA